MKSPFNKSLAQNPGGGKNASEIVRESNRWRDNYNPLRGLAISRVIYLIEAGQRGDYADLQHANDKMEGRFPVLHGLKRRRFAALQKMDWEIMIPATLPKGVTSEMAQAQRKFLRSRYDLIGNLTETIGFLELAEFRGYSVLQKHYFKDGPNKGAVSEFHCCPSGTLSATECLAIFIGTKTLAARCPKR